MAEQLTKYVHDLRLSLDSFTIKYNNESFKFDNACKTFANDFSVLLKQEFIDSLSIFPTSQSEITNKLYCLIIYLKNNDNHKNLRELNDFYLRINSFKFKEDLINYVNNANTFISFCKTPSGRIFEKQLKAAMPIINIWKSYVTNINAYIKIIDELKNLILKQFY